MERELTAPPRIAPARGPSEWYGDGVDGLFWSDEGVMQDDPLAQPAPENGQLDQRVSW